MPSLSGRGVHLVVGVHRVGPYHQARLRALAAGGNASVLEISSIDNTYAWEAITADFGIRRVVAFPHENPATVPARTVRKRCDEVLRRLVPDVLVVPGWGDRVSLALLGWSLGNGVPTIVASDSNQYDKRRRSWRELVKTVVVRGFDGALVAGQDSLEYAVSLGIRRDRVAIGADVVDNQLFGTGAAAAHAAADDVRRRLRLPRDYFLCCARFVEKKNIPRLIEAYSKYVAANDGRIWDLVLVGDGPMRPKIESLVAAAGLGARVHFAGFRQIAELPAIYGLARALVHLSTEEQWGLVVNEAMACGLPVIVSRACGCVRDLARDGETAFVVDPFDIPAIANAMYRLSSDPARASAMGRAGEARIRSWDTSRYASALWSLANALGRSTRRQSSLSRRAAVRILAALL